MGEILPNFVCWLFDCQSALHKRKSKSDPIGNSWPQSGLKRHQISESFRNRLNDEYGMGGKNGRFRSIVLSPECSIGQASTLMNFLSTQSKIIYVIRAPRLDPSDEFGLIGPTKG